MSGQLCIEVLLQGQKPQQHTVTLPLELGRGQPILTSRSLMLSRRHALVFRRASGLYLQDLGSLLGTRLNGIRVSGEQLLVEGDLIQLGPYGVRIVALDTGVFSCDDTHPVAPSSQQNVSTAVASSDASYDQLPEKLGTALSRLHAELLERLDLARRDLSQVSDVALYQEAYELMGQILSADHRYSEAEKQYLQQAVCDEALRLGVLERFLADESISEVMVNRFDCIYIEQAGRLVHTPLRFSSEASLRAVLDRIVAPLGRRIDEQSPLVDARLSDGSRVHAVIAPIAIQGACLTLRKFPLNTLSMADWQVSGGLSADMLVFLRQCVVARINCLVVGGTGTGKTSLLNALSAFIPEHERLVTIEDTAELRLQHQNLVALEARPANSEGSACISIRELLRNALRMRPDRIIVGECRGAEAFDMLSAMNTGHEGSLSTLHANSPRDALSRLESMVLMAGMDLPLAIVREHIVAAVQCLVQLRRLPCGQRIIEEIVEVSGIESGRIQTQSLYRYQDDPKPSFIAHELAAQSPRLRAVWARLTLP